MSETLEGNNDACEVGSKSPEEATTPIVADYPSPRLSSRTSVSSFDSVLSKASTTTTASAKYKSIDAAKKQELLQFEKDLVAPVHKRDAKPLPKPELQHTTSTATLQTQDSTASTLSQKTVSEATLPTQDSKVDLLAAFPQQKPQSSIKDQFCEKYGIPAFESMSKQDKAIQLAFFELQQIISVVADRMDLVSQKLFKDLEQLLPLDLCQDVLGYCGAPA